jgi:hypothetical protein
LTPEHDILKRTISLLHQWSRSNERPSRCSATSILCAWYAVC